MRVLHVVPSFAPAWRYGGPIRSVLRLCQALRGCGVTVEVATTNSDGAGDLDVPVDVLTSFEDVPVRYFRRWPRVDYSFSPSLARFAARSTHEFDLVHITSTFSFPALAAGYAARRSGVPYIVSPRGSLQDWSLRQKSWKKRPYWSLVECAHLRRAAAIHTTADLESDAVRAVLPGANVATVPNGMDPVGDLSRIRRLPTQVVFLGRIHRKKGFDVLIPALARVARELPDVETVVAGPDDEGEWVRVQHLIDAVTPRPRLRYIGPVHGDERFRLLAQSAVFVLPSHSENFGMTVVEALACGAPVVVSRNCPWQSVAEAGAGAWVDNTEEEVGRSILRILRNPAAATRMGEAGRYLAAKYTWSSVGRSMARLYDRIVGTGAYSCNGSLGV